MNIVKPRGSVHLSVNDDIVDSFFNPVSKKLFSTLHVLCNVETQLNPPSSTAGVAHLGEGRPNCDSIGDASEKGCVPLVKSL